jgi:4-amino-4-deoxy-L-arabinose transferase-like glycosyltransferase
VTPTSFSQRCILWGLVFLLGLSLLAGLGRHPLRDYRESRFAELGKEVLEGPDWLVPHLNGSPYLNKPPLLPWGVALSFKALGVGEGAARLPSALAALCTALGVGFMAGRLWGRGKGPLGALLFLGTPGAHYYGRMLMSDMLAMAFMTWALAAFVAGCLQGARGWHWAGFVLCGLAVLSRGVVGVLYPVGALALFTFVIQRGQWRNIPWTSGLALFLLVTVPWFLAAELRHPGALEHQLLAQQLERALPGDASPFVALPRWQIVLSLAGLLGPLSLILPWSLGRFRSPGGMHGLLWVFAGLVVASVLVSSGRNHPYTVPALPVLACLGAGCLDGVLREGPRGRLPWLLTAVLGGAVLASLGWTRGILETLSPAMGEARTVLAVRASMALVGIALLGAALLLRRGNGVSAALALGAMMLPTSWMLLQVQSHTTLKESRAHLGRWIAREIPPHWPLVVVDPRDRQFEGTGGWAFYAGRAARMVVFDEPATVRSQAAGLPSWVMGPDELTGLIRSGGPLVLAATPLGVTRLGLEGLPPPDREDGKFRLWVIQGDGPEAPPPQTSLQTGSRSSSRT